jgi:exopolysaccharide production protein ExoQ
MSPNLATIICSIGILGLFVLDRDRQARTSKALWIPVVWLAISGSRMVSQWLTATGLTNPTVSLDAAEKKLDGSPLDRFLLTMLVLMAVMVLVGRRKRVGALLRTNTAILLFLLYCGASTLWSDYTGVSFKRWINALGDLAMVLIVLTEQDRNAAVKRLLARVGFLLIPLSILVIKYFPVVGRGWSEWGSTVLAGVATSKNELGGICLLFGVGSVWRIVQGLRGSASRHSSRSLIAHGTLVAMALFLMLTANTMTALSCFLIATALIIATSVTTLRRKSWLVHILVLGFVSMSCLALFFNAGAGLVETMGRDATLTGRTGIWKLVTGMTGNPMFGTGFESFWLGPRLKEIWSVYWWHPNEAHNGYIEVFLNLGWVGIALLGVVYVTSYRNTVRVLCRDPDTGTLRLAYFVVAVVYNFTESAVRIMHPVWILFLLVGIEVREGWTVKETNQAAEQATSGHKKPLGAEILDHPIHATR